VFRVGVDDCERCVDIAGEELPLADPLPARDVGDSSAVTVSSRARV
jgi:hypothetical protein